jgi:hypothetical protein
MDAFEPHDLLVPAAVIASAAVLGYVVMHAARFVIDVFTSTLVTVVISAVVSLLVVSYCGALEEGCSVRTLGSVLSNVFTQTFGSTAAMWEVAKSYYRMIKRYQY